MNNTKNQFDTIFHDKQLYRGRMISGSKSGYRKRNPYNLAIFNAKIYDSLEKMANPIWHGDLDINNDGAILKEISNAMKKILYVVYEGGTNNNFGIVWDTTKPIPVVTPEFIAMKIEEEKEDLRQYRISILKKLRKEILENRLHKTVDLIQNGSYVKKIEFPQKLLEKELENFYAIVTKFKRIPKRDSPKFEKYFKTYGYFSAYFLDTFLLKILNIQEKCMINPSGIWISRTLNKKLRVIDLDIEKVFDLNFNYGKFGRYVTCNYCVDYIDYMNKNNIHKDSYENNYLYVRSDFEKESIKFIYY